MSDIFTATLVAELEGKLATAGWTREEIEKLCEQDLRMLRMVSVGHARVVPLEYGLHLSASDYIDLGSIELGKYRNSREAIEVNNAKSNVNGNAWDIFPGGRIDKKRHLQLVGIRNEVLFGGRRDFSDGDLYEDVVGRGMSLGLKSISYEAIVYFLLKLMKVSDKSEVNYRIAPTNYVKGSMYREMPYIQRDHTTDSHPYLDFFLDEAMHLENEIWVFSR